ncbi:phosphate ABC transporter substrate-binding protein PstS [Jiangella sp. DSM 45060]|uniref:phosphate ABC transporter substrate-binding protein PstS n=1 Tax=Jiangella sp. DSM 45060 TaxID=1798224 RepID=UPI00087DA59B|nr:phosphate ABC transporter substrate-binding protein PstS [Jiangella sp. DSM 45060]SDT73040.1 phosphate ABC transporter substrate-binding protein, PhoT family [Jiangella sp. DSM 45060]
MNLSIVRRTLAPVAVASAAALVLAACGSDPDTDNSSNEESPGGGSSEEPNGDAGGDLSGTLNGAGASSQESAVQAWIAGFQGQYPDVTVNYAPEGSGAGREQFTSGAVAFAGSDAALDEEELAAAETACGAPAVDLPLFIDPIAVPYNLPGVDNLQLGPVTLANIFNGTITTWNDPAIVADNPDATLPDTTITPVHRSDESGTTENFVEYLAAAAPEAWTYEVSGEWPGDLPGEAGAQTPGVIAAVQAAEGTIGYASAAAVGDLQTAAIGVGAEFVEYSAEAAAAVVDASPRAEGRAENDIVLELARDTTESGAYPIVLVSYTVVCTSYADPAVGDLVKAYVGYVASDEGQQAAAAAAGSAPISPELQAEVQAVVESIEVG